MLNRNVAADMFPVPFPAEFQKTKDHNPEQNQKMEHETRPKEKMGNENLQPAENGN